MSSTRPQTETTRLSDLHVFKTYQTTTDTTNIQIKHKKTQRDHDYTSHPSEEKTVWITVSSQGADLPGGTMFCLNLLWIWIIEYGQVDGLEGKYFSI